MPSAGRRRRILNVMVSSASAESGSRTGPASMNTCKAIPADSPFVAAARESSLKDSGRSMRTTISCRQTDWLSDPRRHQGRGAREAGLATVQEGVRPPARTSIETFTRDHEGINLEAEAIRREQLTIWKYEWILPRANSLRDTLTAHIHAAEEEIFSGLSRGALTPDSASQLVRQDHELIGELSNMEMALRIHDGLQFRLALQRLVASLAVHDSLERVALFPILDGPSPGPNDWSEQGWVYLETTDGRKFTGYLNEQDGEYVYLHFTRIWDRTSDWLDRWTWTEKNGELPSLDRVWGCTGVKKATVRVVKNIGETYPGDVGRCWVCGRKVDQGHLCSSECEEAYNALASKR